MTPAEISEKAGEIRRRYAEVIRLTPEEIDLAAWESLSPACRAARFRRAMEDARITTRNWAAKWP